MTSILPGATIGVLGGGQLGRMLAFEARRMGYRVVVLDPDPDSPAGRVADASVAGALDDLDAAAELAAQADVVAIDSEHVPTATLAHIAGTTVVHPRAEALGMLQDRLTQKSFLAQRGFPVAEFEPVSDEATLAQACGTLGLPAVLKTRRSGYDGKGQAPIGSEAEAAFAWERIGKRPAVLERFVAFRAEISVIVGRGEGNRRALFPIAENVHRRHALHTTRVPARVSDKVRKRAEEIAVGIADACDLVGVTAVEMFLLDDDHLLVNEVAPRVHNSGHYTLGACVTSQFEQHLRAICGLPLGDPSLLRPAVMLNLFGELWSHDGAPNWKAILRHPDARLHVYGKRTPEPGRKMGHVLFLDDDPDRAHARADAVLGELLSGAVDAADRT